MVYKTFNRFALLIMLVLPAIVVSGCVSGVHRRSSLQEEKAETLELKKSISDIERRLEELANKFLLLQEKVESNKDRIEALGGTVSEEAFGAEADAERAAGEGSATPPEGLRVIRLKGAAAKKPGKQAPVVVVVGPEKLYERGQDFFISGKYKESRRVLGEIVERFPGHSLADNALYWTGEAYYAEGNYKQALTAFDEVGYRYPESNKAPDALLKAAFSHLELGEDTKGVNALRDLMELYPQSEAAPKAARKLKKLSPPN